MYKSFITNEIFENEHDEKMTRKFSYNYKVLKRLFPEIYKLPEGEIRSLVRSIYDNPKMGDELLDHLSDVINKKKPEWGEYLNPKPEEPEQTVQNNPLQPVQPKPLNTGSGFEPYKPQKSAFGLGNTNNFGLNNAGRLNGFGQTKLPDLTKGMDLKHSDMVTGFGINEAKQKEMLGTGFSMPKLPKMPTSPKAPEPQTSELPQMPEIPQALHIQPMQQYPQVQLAYSAYNNQPPTPLVKRSPRNVFVNDYLVPEIADDLSDLGYGIKLPLNGITLGNADNVIQYMKRFAPVQYALAASDMIKHYILMRADNTKKNDDYFHCKAHFDATRRGKYGERFADYWGDRKEGFDYYWNLIKGLTPQEAITDYNHDRQVNKNSIHLSKNPLYRNAKEGCQRYRVDEINDRY